MDNLLTALSLLGLTLAFHFIFSVIGVCLPLKVTTTEWRWRRTNQPAYLLVAKCWVKGTAIPFALAAGAGALLCGIFGGGKGAGIGSVIGAAGGLATTAFDRKSHSAGGQQVLIRITGR